MAQILPAIIPSSFDDLNSKIDLVSSYVNSIQVDIIDGNFAPSKSWPFIEGNIVDYVSLLSGGHVIHALDDIVFELDMMVVNPENYINGFVDLGIDTFIIHLGSTVKMEHVINQVRENQRGLGLAIKPSTPIEDIASYINRVDFVQIMGNDKIGYHRIELDENVFQKVRDLRNRYKNIIISIDIGVNFSTASKLIEAGVDKLVSGSAIYESENIEEAIQKLKQK